MKLTNRQKNMCIQWWKDSRGQHTCACGLNNSPYCEDKCQVYKIIRGVNKLFNPIVAESLCKQALKVLIVQIAPEELFEDLL